MITIDKFGNFWYSVKEFYDVGNKLMMIRGNAVGYAMNAQEVTYVGESDISISIMVMMYFY